MFSYNIERCKPAVSKLEVNRSVTGKTIVYSGSEIGVHDGKFIPFTPDEVKKK